MRAGTGTTFIGWVAACAIVFMTPVIGSAIPFEMEKPSKGVAAQHFSDGVQLLKKGDSKGAEAAFRKSLEVIPNHVAVLAGLAEAQLQQGKQEEARATLEQAKVLQPKNASIHQAWGRFLLAQKEYKKSEEAFLKAAQLNLKDASVQSDLGNLYLGPLKSPKRAIKSFATAIKLEPKDVNAHLGLGASYAASKMPKKALSELNEAVRLAPDNPVPYLAIGNLHREQKEFDQSVTAYDAALKIDPRFLDAIMAKGDLLAGLGKLEDAKRSYQSITELHPNHPVAYNNLAWIAAEQKSQLADAVTWAKKAVALAPSVPQFKDTLGWVYRANGDLALANETLAAALSEAQNNATIAYHLGVVLHEQGKSADARSMLEKSLKLKLELSLARDAEQRLKGLMEGHKD